MSTLTRTARATGAWYLGIALTGMLGFLVLRPTLFTDSPADTVAALAERTELAHLAVVLELGIVLTQAVGALWFFRLLRRINPAAAVGVLGFGLVNAVAILASAAFMATAVRVAADPSLAPGADAQGTVAFLQELSAQSWAVGAVFFGLWLIPMGWVALRQGRFPTVLGWFLTVGGVGYVLSAFADMAFADAPSALIEGLTMPASVGEFWMIAYLLVKGIRRDDHARVRALAPTTLAAAAA